MQELVALNPEGKDIEKIIQENNDVLNSLKEILTDKKRIVEYGKKRRSYEFGDIEQLETELKETQTTIVSINIREKAQKCPNCHVNLCLNDHNVLEIVSSDYVNTSDKVQEQLALLDMLMKRIESAKKYNDYTDSISSIKDNYESDLPDINTIIENIQEIELENQNYKQTLSKISELKKKLDRKLYSKRLQEEMKQIDYDSLPSEIDVDVTELKNNLKQMKDNEQHFNSLQNIKSEKEKILRKKQQDIKNNQLDNMRDISLIEADIKNKQEEIKEIEERLKIHNENIEKIEEYKNYIKELEPWNDWKAKIKTLQEEEEKFKELYSCALKLKEKIGITESVVLQNILDEINTHTNHFLESFFPDNPIVVLLSTTKETLKGDIKNQINVTVHYKEMETDLSSLSGGEISRVVLATSLSLSTIFSSKLILLDECTSSLNIELNDVVLETIKKEFSDRLVLIISHQVSTHAIFDKVIHV